MKKQPTQFSLTNQIQELKEKMEILSKEWRMIGPARKGLINMKKYHLIPSFKAQMKENTRIGFNKIFSEDHVANLQKTK